MKMRNKLMKRREATLPTGEVLDPSKFEHVSPGDFVDGDIVDPSRFDHVSSEDYCGDDALDPSKFEHVSSGDVISGDFSSTPCSEISEDESLCQVVSDGSPVLDIVRKIL